MNLLQKIFNPKKYKFSLEFNEEFSLSYDQIKNFDIEHIAICQQFIATSPYIYFSEVFLYKSKYNSSFRWLFQKSLMEKPDKILSVTQAYFIYYLFQILKNDKNFYRYSKKIIQKDLIKLKNSNFIDQYLVNFINANEMNDPRALNMMYLREVITILYNDNDIADELLFSLNVEDELWLDIFSTDLIIDSKKFF